jgi:hypothetical protein
MESAHYVRDDQNGNRFLYRAKVSDMKDARVVRWAWDVALLQNCKRRHLHAI